MRMTAAKKNKRLEIRLSEAEYEAIENLAFISKSTMSDVLRMAFRMYRYEYCEVADATQGQT